MSSGEWFDGKAALPPLISLKTRYEGGGDDSNELSAEEKAELGSSSSASAAAASTPAPTKTESAPAPKPAPAPVQQPREVKTELQDNKKAMADMANKFADKEEEEDEEDSDDSFEEVPKPVERPVVRAADPIKPTSASAPTPAMASSSVPISSTPKPAVAPQTATTATTAAAASSSSSSATAAEPARATSSSSAPSGGPAEALKTHLSDIKSAQANTRSEIAELKTQVGDLTELVKTLSGRLDALVGSQAERMRRIELEVEELRE
jgi:coronin-1B/1C/6